MIGTPFSFKIAPLYGLRLIRRVFSSSRQKLLIAVLFTAISVSSFGQELEPRLLTNVPVKFNFLVANYGYTQGNILLDPSIQIEDLNSKLHAFIVGYARSFSLFGMSAKVDAVVPLASGFWDGDVSGEYLTREVSGFGDPRIRLSVNFVGAPAISAADYASYKPKTIAGVSLQIFLPLGQYDPDKLINLGGNRFVFKPQLGWSTRSGTWIFESYLSMWIFTPNTEFFGGSTMTQLPLYAIKQHVIHSFKNKTWMSLNAGYAFGGESIINEKLSDSRISSLRLGFDYSIPVAKQHTLKLTANKAILFEKGPAFNSASITYQFRWL